MSKRETLVWLGLVEKKGTLFASLAVSGKGFGKLDCLIASSLSKLMKGEVAREISTQAEKLFNDDGSLLTGRQLLFIMYQEFEEDMRKTLPHAIAELSKLSVKNAQGLAHWLASFNSIVQLNTELQPDFIDYQCHLQLKCLDCMKDDVKA